MDDGPQGLADQGGAVELVLEMRAGGQVFGEGGELSFHGRHGGARIGPDPQEGQDDSGLALPVLGGSPLNGGRALLHVGDLGQQDGGAAARGDDDLADIIERLDQADAPDDALGRSLRQE